MKFRLFIFALIITINVIGVAACKREVPIIEQPTEGGMVSASASKPVPGSIIVEVMANEDRMRVTGSGEKIDGKVHATGVAGALIFGPYMPLMPGAYSLLIEGNSRDKFDVDVVHSSGNKQIAARKYTAKSGNAAGNGSLAVLDFEVIEPVENAEFRVIVPDGADTTVTSYKLIAK